MSLYQLPNGNWVVPHAVEVVAVLPGQYASDANNPEPFKARVRIVLKAGFGMTIDCESFDAAVAMRDKIATDLNVLMKSESDIPRKLPPNEKLLAHGSILGGAK